MSGFGTIWGSTWGAGAVSGGPATCTDGLTVSSSATQRMIRTLIANLALTGQPSTKMTMKGLADDAVDFDDVLAIAWKRILAENVALTGTAVGTPQRLAALVDELHALGVVDSRANARVAVATAIALNTLLASGWTMSAVSSASFQSALAGQLHALAPVLDQAGFTTTVGPALRITVLADAHLALLGNPAASLHQFAALSDGVLMYTVLRLGAAEYAGWVLNQGAPSEYRNYPFNGFAAFAGDYYGTSDDGLYLLEGDTDDGTPIDAHIKTGLMDFGTGLLKRVPDVYVSTTLGNKVVLKVVTTGRTGVQRTDIYTASVPAAGALHNVQLKPGGGLESRYWQFQLENVGGGEFALDELTFRPLLIDRRR